MHHPTTTRVWKSVWYTLYFALLVHAQTCENYGLLNGSSCVCPAGFGGSTCSQLACGGTIFQGSQRPLTPSTLTGSFANLTASGCKCESGWTGTGCNVCQTANACQSGFAAAGQGIDSSTIDGLQGNTTLVCNTQSRVWASSQMSCQVNVHCFPYRPPRAQPTATESDASIIISTCIHPEHYTDATTRI